VLTGTITAAASSPTNSNPNANFNANSNNGKYGVSSVTQLKEEIAKLKIKGHGKINKEDALLLVSNTDPTVFDEFTESKIQAGFDAINNTDVVFDSAIGDTSYGKQVVDLGDETSVTFLFEDGRDLTFFEKTLAIIRDFFVEPVYAASGSNTTFKEWGSRYFTTTVQYNMLGIGGFNLAFRNHYSVNAVRDKYGLVIGGTIDAKPIDSINDYDFSFYIGSNFTHSEKLTITNQQAKSFGQKEGKSIEIQGKKMCGAGSYVSILWSNYRLDTYVAHNGANNSGINVIHSWDGKEVAGGNA